MKIPAKTSDEKSSFITLFIYIYYFKKKKESERSNRNAEGNIIGKGSLFSTHSKKPPTMKKTPSWQDEARDQAASSKCIGNGAEEQVTCRLQVRPEVCDQSNGIDRCANLRAR